MNLFTSQNIQMKIRTVITVLVLLCCYVGQRTQPAVTEADCCFFHLCRFCGICSGQEIFLAPSLNAAWNLGLFFFSPTPPRPFLVYIYLIFFLPQLWLEALCFQYIWLSYFHECDIPQTHGGNFIILATNVPSDSRMNWLEFCGQKLKDGATSQTHYWKHNC